MREKKSFVSYMSSPLNAVSALLNRQLGTKVLPSSIHINRLGLWFNTTVAPKILNAPYTPYSVEQYCID